MFRLIQERAFWVAWSGIQGVGPTLLQRIYQQFGSLSSAWQADCRALEAVDGIGTQSAETIVRGRSHLDPAQMLAQHVQTNPTFWTPADPEYPRLLLEISDPPPILYYHGRVEPDENRGLIPAIAIVGTRNPSDYGRRWTRSLSKALAQAGFVIVSGLADGIDTEAHRSCVAVQGRTIAVLGTGVDVVYPWSNRNLAQQIIDTGLLVSEYPAGTQPDRVNFPRRNRIIAGLCRATLVLEAPHKSGALITAHLANDYGRDIYVLPGSLDNPNAHGCLRLIEKGAHVILDQDELLEALGTIPSLHSTTTTADQLTLLTPSPVKLPPDLDQILHLTSSEPCSLDTIVEQSLLPTGTVLGALAQLELMGFVAQLPGMHYRRC